ncbi:beta strand repeat-containing protein, partial [Patescibacteria group bacterium]
MFIPSAVAQDASNVQIDATVEDGCSWSASGQVFPLPEFNLDVWDDEICVIRGLGREVYEVNVHEDGVIELGGGSVGGQAGGRLIIGSQTLNEDTVFTMYGPMYFDGIVEVGNGTGHDNYATLATDAVNFNNVNISSTSLRSDGTLTVIENTTAGAHNTINFDNSQVFVGNTIGGTTGIFTHDDDSTTSSIYRSRVEGGAFNNLQGTLTSNQEIDINGSSTFNNDGILTITNGNFRLSDTSSGTNGDPGVINLTNGNFRNGDSTTNPTFNNSGDIYQPNGDWFEIQGDFTNTSTGTVTAQNIVQMANSDVVNYGAFTATTGGTTGIYALYDDDGDGNISTFENNNGATFTADNFWVVAGNYNSTTKPVFNNNVGGTITADNINLGFFDAGVTELGAPGFWGGILNNYDAITVSGSTGMEVYRGGKFNNESTGTIDIQAGPLTMGTDFDNSTPGDVTDDGMCLSSGDADNCTVTNDNTTDPGSPPPPESPFKVYQDVNMYGYSYLDNDGEMRISTDAASDNFDIHANNANISNGLVNGLNSTIHLEGGDETFDFDVAVDNDGEIIGSGPIYFNDTASLDNASGAVLTNNTGGGGSIIIDGSDAHVTNAGTVTLSNLLQILDDGYYEQSGAGSSVSGTLLYLDDVTAPVSPYFTMTDGTATFTGEVRVYEGSTINVTGATDATFTGATLYLGVVSSTNGGVFNIDQTGSASFTGAAANNVYQGTLDIKSSNTATTPLSITYDLFIDGDVSEQGVVNHYGSGTVSALRLTRVYGYGELNIDNGTWNQNNQNFYVYADVDPYEGSEDPNDPLEAHYDNDSYGKINIGSNGTLYNLNTILIGESGTRGGSITNAGTISTPASDIIYLYNGGKLDNSGTINIGISGGNLRLRVNEGFNRKSYVINRPSGSITTQYLYSDHNSHIIDNLGYIRVTNYMILGYAGQGGTFNNGDAAGTNPGELNGTARLYIQNGGVVNNNADSLISGYNRGELCYYNNYPAIAFDNQTYNYNIGHTIEGADSGATADILVVDDDGTRGTLFLTNISGTFQDDEIIFEQTPYLGSAQANGVVISPAAFSVGDTITGQYYGSTALIDSIDDDGPGGNPDCLTLSSVTGNFNNNDSILGTTQGAAMTTSTFYPGSLGTFRIAGSGTLGDSTFNQLEGTDAPNQYPKVLATAIEIQTDGVVNNYDYIKLSNLNMSQTGTTYNGLLGTGTVGDLQDSKLLLTSMGSSMNGDMLIEGNDVDYATIEPSNTFSIYSSGVVDLYGQLLAHTGSAKVSVGGTFKSYADSYISFDTDSTGFDLFNHLSGTPFAELGGTVDAYKIQATSTQNTLDGGYMCLGDYVGGFCVDSGNTITISNLLYAKNETGTGTTVVDIAVDLDLTTNLKVESGTSTWSTEVNQLPSSTITLTDNSGLEVRHQNSTFNSNGPLIIDGNSAVTDYDYIYMDGGTVNLDYTTAPYDIGGVKLFAPTTGTGDSVLNLAAGAVLNLDDIENCTTTVGDCAILLHDNAANTANKAIFNVNGTVNTVAGTEQSIQIGYIDSTDGHGELNIGATGTVNLNNTTGGIIQVDDSGKLVIAAGGVLNSDSPMDVDGMYNDGTGDRGAYIGGTATVDTSLDIEATGTMDVGSSGTMTVSGSTTTVNGNMELDGTLNPGDLTVTSTGVISSGDGNHLTTGSGCGVGGNFGCGYQSNFFIDATSVNVQASGQIASDDVSTRRVCPIDADASGPDGGAYGGEGLSPPCPTNTHGTLKIGGSTANHGSAGSYNTPYGEAGFTNASTYTEAGGAVYIRSTGDITINGEVRANGGTNNIGSQATGSGGTVIIEQDIDHTDTTAVFNGAGYIRANGGNSSGAGNTVGGGGRILIESILLDEPGSSSTEYDFDLSHIEALGGANSADSAYAAAGTMVFIGDDNNPNGTLIVDQNSNGPTSVETEIPSTTTATLDYDAQTANFNIGATLTGGLSTATATITADVDNGTDGTLTLTMLTGAFQNNETITDDGGSPGSATSNGVELYNDTVDRIEARNGAVISYVNDTNAPTVCYRTGTGTPSITYNS